MENEVCCWRVTLKIISELIVHKQGEGIELKIRQNYSQQRTLTQHDMLPQQLINIKELINECF